MTGFLPWYISIHAPVLGATQVADVRRSSVAEFQSTHPCWVRHRCFRRQIDDLIYFNPRTRAGCDIHTGSNTTSRARISIHAPVLGATCGLIQSKQYREYISIHAPVLGATPREWHSIVTHVDFNPRTRAGCDAVFFGHRSAVDCISIHAPVLGATSDDIFSRISPNYFNPRTRAGCDSKVTATCRASLYFNPRTRAGCDKNVEKTCP